MLIIHSNHWAGGGGGWGKGGNSWTDFGGVGKGKGNYVGCLLEIHEIEKARDLPEERRINQHI